MDSKSIYIENKTQFLLNERYIFTTYRYKILLTYIFTIFENVTKLLLPSVTGEAINKILKSDYSGTIALVFLWIIHGGIYILRSKYNIRIFSTIYRDIVTKVINTQKKFGVETSKIIARSGLSREFIDFFERIIPTFVSSVFSCVGAVFMLYCYDYQIAIYCGCLAIPLFCINRNFAKSSYLFNKSLNDQYEREVEILTDNNLDMIWDHYGKLSFWRIKLIDAQVSSWGSMEFFVIFLLFMVISRSGSLDNVAAGTVYSILSYTWNFVNSLDQVPYIIQQLGRLKDIKVRMMSA